MPAERKHPANSKQQLLHPYLQTATPSRTKPTGLPTTDDTPAPASPSTTTDITDTSLQPTPSSTTPPKPPHLTLNHHAGSLFDAPPNTVLIHSCNVQGSWGAGIAAAFRKSYPQAYAQYRTYCLTVHKPTTDPVSTGTCLLIPPCETKPGAPRHWVACLFTSAKYGKRKDGPDTILRNTGSAVRELLKKVREVKKKDGVVDGMRMCRINSGLFGVEWERTAEVLQNIEVGMGEESMIEVWTPEE